MPLLRYALAACLIASTPTFAQSFADATVASGITIPAAGTTNGFDRPVCWGDFDGDGDQDLVVSGLLGTMNTLWLNNGNGTFTASAQSGLGLAFLARACTAGDIDNDGDLDLYVACSAFPSKLYLNDGTGTFAEVGAAAGVAHMDDSFSAAFGDYDRDGFLDLYVGNNAFASPQLSGANILYHNNGDGTFTDVTATAGCGDTGNTFAGVWFDYDEDGWPDIHVSNDHGDVIEPNGTYRNNGDGTFTNTSALINTQVPMLGMGSDVGDLFNDGGWDVYVTNTSTTAHVFHEWDPTTSSYVDNAVAYGIAGYQVGWAVHFFDYGNDGWQDIYVNHNNSSFTVAGVNALFKNPGPAGGVWTDEAANLGVDITGWKYTNAVADYDDDGAIDILQIQVFSPAILLKNNAATGNWLKIRTVGTRSNRDGIGAVVKVTAGGLTQRRMVKSGSGFMSGSDLRVHFGLGTASLVDQIEIRWPSGQVQYLAGVAVNQILTVVEPDLSLDAPASTGTAPNIVLSAQGDAGLPFVTLLTLSTTPPLMLSDGRTIPVFIGDPVALLTLTPGNPILPTPFGSMSASSTGQSQFFIPGNPILAGISLWATAVTLDPAFTDGIKTIIDPPRAITLQ